MADRQAQKGMVSGHVVNSYAVSTRKEPGVQYQPTVTENEHTERSNLPTALGSIRVGNQPEATAGRMAQEAKALSNVKDKLT